MFYGIPSGFMFYVKTHRGRAPLARRVKWHRRGQRSGGGGGGRVGATGSKKKRIDSDSFSVSALSFFLPVLMRLFGGGRGAGRGTLSIYSDDQLFLNGAFFARFQAENERRANPRSARARALRARGRAAARAPTDGTQNSYGIQFSHNNVFIWTMWIPFWGVVRGM